MLTSGRLGGIVVAPVENVTLLFKFYEEWGGTDFYLPRNPAL